MWSPKLHLLHSVAFHHYLCYVIDISPKQWNWCFFLLRLPSSLSFWKYSAWCLINLCWTNNNFFFLFSFYFTLPNIFCFLLIIIEGVIKLDVIIKPCKVEDFNSTLPLTKVNIAWSQCSVLLIFQLFSLLASLEFLLSHAQITDKPRNCGEGILRKSRFSHKHYAVDSSFPEFSYQFSTAHTLTH